MNTIQYRSIRPQDYPAVCDILSDSFGLETYVEDTVILESLKKQYLYSCLSEATFTCVAVKNGVVIGIIMGNARKNYIIYKHFISFLKTAWFSLKMIFLYGNQYESLRGYSRLHKIYKKFRKKHSGEFGGVLTLFAVSEKSRGLGIGKALWNCLRQYFIENEVQKIYLYTDSTCNTGFYDHHGFEMIEREKLSLVKLKKQYEMDVFLYQKTVI